VKPQNVLLSREGEVKVTDFGIARSLEVEHGVTQTGTVLGTGEYLAPEQASGQPVSPATDVYSLGVVLWELLAGDVPFAGENFVAVALRHVNEPPPSLHDVRPDVSPRLAATVDRALAKDPARRFPSMAALAKELRACLAEADGDVPPPPPPEDDAALTLVRPAPARRVPARRRRRPVLLYALLALVAGGAALAVVLVLGGGGHHGVLGGGGGGPSGAAVQLHGLAGYDPQGDGTEHNELAANATDGDPATSWTTERYDSQAFGGLKSGVGLMLDAGRAVKLASVTVSSPTGGFEAEIESGSSTTGSFSVDSSSQPVSGTTTFTLDGQTAQYYVVWITELPPGGRAEISEVTAKS
jgi:serine/threonine-protein kinase